MEIREYRDFKKNEIQHLYTDVGWRAYTENMLVLEQVYKNSLLVLAAYENRELLVEVSLQMENESCFHMKQKQISG